MVILLRRDPGTGSWLASDLLTGARLVNYTGHNQFPVGVAEWQVAGCGTQRLKLTSCQGKQFGCGTGHCVDIGRRCDGRNDCDDLSDEQSCGTVVVDRDSYRSHDPPSASGGGPGGVEVSLTVMEITGIRELDSAMTIKFQMEVEWRDGRLGMRNLKQEKTGNMLGEDEKTWIWYPRSRILYKK